MYSESVTLSTIRVGGTEGRSGSGNDMNKASIIFVCLCVGLQVCAAENWFQNPGFESGDLTGWNTGLNDPSCIAFVVGREHQRTAANALKVVNRKFSAGPANDHTISQTIDFGEGAELLQGKEFTVSIFGYYECPDLNPKPEMQITVTFDAGSRLVSDTMGYSGSYAELSFCGTVPSDAKSVTIEFKSHKTARGKFDYYLDDARFVIGVPNQRTLGLVF